MNFYENLSAKVPVKICYVPSPLPGARWATIKGKKVVFQLKRRHDNELVYVAIPEKKIDN